MTPPLCRTCGTENPGGFRFCGSCGASLDPVPAHGVRKVVTVVFCDLAGSTALGEQTDPEALRATMRGYYERMRGILERHGGTVEKFIGDAVMAVFGIPVAHEDDALRAVRAAWEMRGAVAELDLHARFGVNTGEVAAGGGDTLVTGDAVNVAARLEQAADAGEVLIGPQTRRLVRGAIAAEPSPVTAKGKTVPIEAFRLLRVDPHAEAIDRRFDTPLVGRRFELEELRTAFRRSVRQRRCHMLTVLGAAGIGKSRLAAELLGGLDATILSGRCPPYGEGITFRPIVSILKQLGARASDTLGRLAEGTSTPNELFWLVRQQLEEVALERPLVVVFDDVQWGEETFLDLIDHVADLSREAPLLLLCLARPELLDRRPAWGGGKLNAMTLLLEPLTAGESEELIEAHGGGDLQTRQRIVETAEGNPLFLEEMVALVREGDGAGIPSSVQALLQARLDQLGHEERAVLESGAVEGQVFHRGAVLELTRAPEVDPQLKRLVRTEFIRPESPTVADGEAFRFRHLLIRDAAYEALPKQTRAELHERFAGWLEKHGADLVELEDTLGYHLEQAARYLRELGRADPGLERRAGRHLAAAGSRAAYRSDAHGAAGLLRRALDLLPADDDHRPAAILDSLVMLTELGEPERRAGLIEELERSEDPCQRMRGQVARVELRISMEPDRPVDQAETVAREAIEYLAGAGDDRGAATAYALLAFCTWKRSLAVATVAAFDRMLEHAERAGDRLITRGPAMQLAGPLMFGPFTEGSIRARLARLPTKDSPAVLWVESELARRDKRFDEALELLERASRIQDDLGLAVAAALTKQRRAEILRDQGRLDEAVATYRDSVVRLEALGQKTFLSTTLVDLALALYERGDLDEATGLAVQGERLGGVDDVVNFAYGRGLRARIAADRDAPQEAEALAREALAHAYQTDFPSVQAGAHRSLGYALTLAGRREEAGQELRRALDLWRRYGYTLEAERAAADLERLG